MTEFKLDPRLQNDCFIMKESEHFFVLLMNNSQVPWFILVPKTDQTELYQLNNNLQVKILDMVNRLSKFVIDEFKADKLNVAAIGNIVNQMHIHIVGRHKSDAYWPGVVWGADQKTAYPDKKVKRIKLQLNSILEI